jgi:flagellar basal body rod protein FlgG
MPYGLYISAEGAQAQVARMEVIANNLANVETPGFKRDLAIFEARYAEAIEQGLQDPDTGELEDVGGGVLFQSGAVLGKVLILALLILFIQKRPQGIFALKGRAAEAG